MWNFSKMAGELAVKEWKKLRVAPQGLICRAMDRLINWQIILQLKFHWNSYNDLSWPWFAFWFLWFHYWLICDWLFIFPLIPHYTKSTNSGCSLLLGGSSCVCEPPGGTTVDLPGGGGGSDGCGGRGGDPSGVSSGVVTCTCTLLSGWTSVVVMQLWLQAQPKYQVPMPCKSQSKNVSESQTERERLCKLSYFRLK